ncbi:hypothetical protein AKJ37_02270 [candidate division MSBL1 archaeon SCGC-AAA259I09]|uniref:Molybdopterin oxidoreductase domain-containing protein n=1 Tax=candidate division MSBL1 archaeon SCGC-AAA259I09 TaxID=1698267 RepID=A0A133UUA9_9EURY|nr:hypothetical protein AKJ37_02270 [candidate division MSBL1 archaeon SCGC-AAA259I09]
MAPQVFDTVGVYSFLVDETLLAPIDGTVMDAEPFGSQRLGTNQQSIIILIAITGNIDKKGGNIIPSHLSGYVSDPELVGATSKWRPSEKIERERIGYEKYPLASGPDSPLPFVNSNLALRTMISGEPYPLKAVYCVGGNPVVNCQNTELAVEAFKELDLFVVADLFMTPTAVQADYVLPATTWLEREGCCDISYSNMIAARRKALEQQYESWPDMKIAIELVKKFHGQIEVSYLGTVLRSLIIGE